MQPTIADLQAMGICEVTVSCDRPDCRRAASVAFAALRLPGTTLFPAIRAACRFVCASCGSHAVSVMPDWRGYKAAGNGGPSRAVERPGKVSGA